VEPILTVDPSEVPTEVPTVALTVSDADRALLDADPYFAPDVQGTFTSETGQRWDPVEVNYRGAYTLQSQIQSGDSHRNWKLKFPKSNQYRGRTEWNLNHEPNIRQELAYDLLRFAGVRVPSARHVLLEVNGVPQGLYLQYEDPDSGGWLTDMFGDASGDLYKAATDLPTDPPTKLFATLEYLGDEDAAYVGHYNKKKNSGGLEIPDYSQLRSFLSSLNETPDAGFAPWLKGALDWDKFVSFLVVSNFINNWDSYPQRPKNFWLYQIPAAGHWVFIPWDVDGTFQPDPWGTLNVTGSSASVFWQMDAWEPYGGHSEEGTQRPLVRRAMTQPALRGEYVARYRELMGSLLTASYLHARVDALVGLLDSVATEVERTELHDSAEEIQRFIDERTVKVSAELATLP